MLIYLASPYSANDHQLREKRYNDVLRATAHLVKMGVIVFSPIVNGHPINLLIETHSGSHMSFDVWEKYDCKIIARCDELWVLKLEGWETSVGVAAEVEFAKRLSMKIKHITMEELGL